MPTQNLLDHFSAIKDPRRLQGQRHELRLILLLTLMSIMSGYNGYRAIGDFIKRNRADLLTILKPNKERLPSFDAIRQVLMRIDFSEVSKVFHAWALQYVGITENEWISMDGKVIGGTVTNNQSKEHDFVSLVSLFCSKRKLILGNALVKGSKESEISVVKELVETLDLKGITFSLDALHCQKKRLG
jgi:hypothetical protein